MDRTRSGGGTAMNQSEASQQIHLDRNEQAFRWPIQLSDYDRRAALSEAERVELQRKLGSPHKTITKSTRAILERLIHPIHDALMVFKPSQSPYDQTIRAMLHEMYQRNKTFWSWSEEEWKEVLCPDEPTFSYRHGWASGENYARRHVAALAYLFGIFPDMSFLSTCAEVGPLARKIFGNEAVDGAIEQITTILQSWGYEQKDTRLLTTGIAYLLLQNRSPALIDLSTEVLEHAAPSCPLPEAQRYFFKISRASLGWG